MNKQTTFSVAALLLIATTFAGPVVAADSKSPAAVAVPMTAAAAAPAGEISREQAIEMALKAHPGEVSKAYQDSKKGIKTWEVKISGADGKKWELHYEIKTGALVSEEGK